MNLAFCTAAVKLHPVAFHLVAGDDRKFSDGVGDRALVELLDTSAAGAEEVVVMPAPGDHVVLATVFQKYAADHAEFCEEADRPKDRRPAGIATPRDEIVRGKMPGPRQDGSDDRAARWRNAVTARLQLECDALQI